MSDAWWFVDPIHAWNIATAMAVAAGCALVGTLVVVRRMSLVGDAISHAVLPGIVVAVLAGARPGGPWVMVGAVIAAVATAWLAAGLSGEAGVAEDAGIGVAFTTMFALGVALVSALASRIDLDPACVLHGELELAAFDSLPVAGVEVPRGFLVAVAVFTVIAAGLAATWPAQVFAAFDAAAARAAGVPVGALSMALLAATAVTTVAGFGVAGAVLVVALLVVPAATAELLVDRLHHVARLAIVIGMFAAAVGYLAAWRLDTSASGMIAVVLGACYLAAALAAPADGVIARGVTAWALRFRVAREDWLASLWREGEGSVGVRPRGAFGRLALESLIASGAVERSATGPRLSPTGRSRAETIVRSHRLWEAWLGRNVELPLDHLHPPAEWVEHHIGREVRERLAEELGARADDPHGRAIPPESPGPRADGPAAGDARSHR